MSPMRASVSRFQGSSFCKFNSMATAASRSFRFKRSERAQDSGRATSKIDVARERRSKLFEDGRSLFEMRAPRLTFCQEFSGSRTVGYQFIQPAVG